MLMIEAIRELHQAGLVTDLDWYFARFLQQQAGSDSEYLALAAVLVSRALAQGDVCIDLSALAGRRVVFEDTATALQAPPLTEWRAALDATSVVGAPGAYRPLILDAGDRLYCYRYWRYEQELADDLRRRAQRLPLDIDSAAMRGELAAWFAPLAESETDWQKIAAAVAALRGLSVISGGPGTGKTTTVVRILAVLTATAKPPVIALAAPTGKAAARMQDAVRQAKRTLHLANERLAAIPEEAFTLHRLLGVVSNGAGFRHHRGNPLPLDVLVVDEASMIDLALMARLLEALPKRARLILLGDKDQLASVEAGSVLGDVCAGSNAFTPDFGKQLENLVGTPVPTEGGGIGPLADSVVLLKHSYRFAGEGGIGQLARLVNRGEASAALSLLRSDADGIVWRHGKALEDDPQAMLERFVLGYGAYLEAIKTRAAPEEVFEHFNRFRVLCALRGGPYGAENWNRSIERALQAKHWIDLRRTWYAGRPVMITRNDYNLRLFNGDVGITLPDPSAGRRLRVFFPASGSELRAFSPLRLPEHETVYAMTVHKSQGSEFERVLLILPFDGPHRLTRELVYTGVTRARTELEIWGDPQAFVSIVGRASRRSSGLRDALWSVD